MNDFGHLTDKQLLALCIYGEARGESTAGKIAVGSVVMNRAEKSGWWGHNIRQVILKPYQFSCFLEADPNHKRLKHLSEMWDFEMANDMALNDCYGIASGLLDGTIEKNTRATHYHRKGNPAYWERGLKHVGDIGHHTFFA